jgi:hypothetical protein
MRMPNRVRSALLVVVVLLLGLIGLSLFKQPHSGPSTDDLQRREQQTPYDHQGADPPSD